MNMPLTIFKPDNTDKVVHRGPSVTVGPRGLIVISRSAHKAIGSEQFYFVHIPEDGTTYLVPSPDGFVFRILKDNKGLALNHSTLARKILTMNGGTGRSSIRFRLASPCSIKVENSQVEAWPLILQKR